MKKILLLIFLFLTLYPVLNICDGSRITAQSWTYEGDSYWLNNVTVTGHKNNICSICGNIKDEIGIHMCEFEDPVTTIPEDKDDPWTIDPAWTIDPGKKSYGGWELPEVVVPGKKTGGNGNNSPSSSSSSSYYNPGTNIGTGGKRDIEGRTIENSSLLDSKTLAFVKSLKKGGGKITITRAKVALRNHATTMLNNIKKYGVAYELNVYADYGDMLIEAYDSKLSDEKNIDRMVQIMERYKDPSVFSHHLGGYDSRCTFDISERNLDNPFDLLNEIKGRMKKGSSDYDPNIIKVMEENKCIHVEYRK